MDCFEVAAHDQKTFLLRNLLALNQQLGNEIANTAKQPTTFELNEIGDVKELEGGRYELTEEGWIKIIEIKEG